MVVPSIYIFALHPLNTATYVNGRSKPQPTLTHTGSVFDWWMVIWTASSSDFEFVGKKSTSFVLTHSEIWIAEIF